MAILIKSTAANANGNIERVLWIGIGQYTNAQGKKIDDWVWRHFAVQQKLLLDGFVTASNELRMFNRSLVYTLSGINPGISVGSEFTAKQVHGGLPIIFKVYDSSANAPLLQVNGSVSAPVEVPIPTPQNPDPRALQNLLDEYLFEKAKPLFKP